MSSLQVTVTPGKTFSAGEVITEEKLNQLGIPNIDISGSITAGQLASNAVTTAKITDANVTTAKLADDSVTLDKMEHGTAGDVIYYDGSGVPTRLAKGADGHVLTLASGLPSWVTSGGAATIASGELDLFRLEQPISGTNKVIVYTGPDQLEWQDKDTYINEKEIRSKADTDVYLSLTGADSGVGGGNYIQHRSSTTNTTGIENLVVSTSNEWTFMRRPEKLLGMGLAYNSDYDDAHGAEIDKYFHSYEFEIGNTALAEINPTGVDPTVDTTTALFLEMTYSLPYHGMALFHVAKSNSDFIDLLWATSSSPYDSWKSGAQGLKIDRHALHTEGHNYKFKLIYWENGNTPSDRPRFDLQLVGYMKGQAPNQ